MSEPAPEVDWLAIGQGAMAIAQTPHTYYHALTNEGFTENQAFQMIQTVQLSIFAGVFNQQPPNPEEN